jgi:hypothetical protein
MAISGPATITVRNILSKNFSLDELQSICTYLEVDYENLPGQGKEAKARELVQFLLRRDRIHELVPAVTDLFPEQNFEWPPELRPSPAISDKPPNSQPQPQPQSQLSHTALEEIITILVGRPMFGTPDGRRAMLNVAGVADYVSSDLNGSNQLVASSVVIELNNYGEVAPGETALGRLLRYMIRDSSLPQHQKAKLEQFIPA